jgi:flagellar motor switch/type III secretory pathway protein FliN
MSQAFNTESDTGEADYFSAILALQNAAQHKSALPQALLDEVACFEAALKIEGIDWPWPKPVLLNIAELTAFGATGNVTVFRRQSDGAQSIIAVDQTAIIALASLLLGGKPNTVKRGASRIETQITTGFIQAINPDFKPIDTPQTSQVWQDFAGAKLPFDERPDSGFVLVMINRRGESASTSQVKTPDIQQQNHLRQALGQGVLNVDYVLDCGQVALASLRNLEAGSVLPLTNLSDQPLEARANGKVVFSGVLNISADRMRFGVTRILAEAPQ